MFVRSSQFHSIITNSTNKILNYPESMMQASYPTFVSSPLGLQKAQVFSPVALRSPVTVRPRRRLVRRQGRFLLQMKILIKCLEKTNDRELLLQVKHTALQCTRQKIYPLQENVELRVQRLVGADLWSWAGLCVDFYLAKREQRTRPPTIEAR